MSEKGDCSFPVAEDRKKWKTFFPGTFGSHGASVLVVRSHGLPVCQVPYCLLPLPHLPPTHPSSLIDFFSQGHLVHSFCFCETLVGL